MKKSVGGKIVTVKGNSELITWQTCDYNQDIDIIRLSGFFIKNEDSKDIYVKINAGSDMLLKIGELYVLEGLTDVASCIVVTDNSRVRWGGLKKC